MPTDGRTASSAARAQRPTRPGGCPALVPPAPAQLLHQQRHKNLQYGLPAASLYWRAEQPGPSGPRASRTGERSASVAVSGARSAQQATSNTVQGPCVIPRPDPIPCRPGRTSTTTPTRLRTRPLGMTWRSSSLRQTAQTRPCCCRIQFVSSNMLVAHPLRCPWPQSAASEWIRGGSHSVTCPPAHLLQSSQPCQLA